MSCCIFGTKRNQGSNIMCYNIALLLLRFVLLVASSQAQSCGKRRVPNLLIVGGTEAREGFWPWHALLFKDQRYRCGGTVLDRNTILTAAHCVTEGSSPVEHERIRVHVGRARLSVAIQRAQELTVDELIIHSEYTTESTQHDIAIIKLSKDITYTNYIQPICLWNQGEDLRSIVGSMGTVIGHGYDESKNVTDTLREVRIPVVDHVTCVKSNFELFGMHLTGEMFCAGDRNGTGPCNGDSGGGLFFSYNNVWYIRGIVSFTPVRVLAFKILCDPEGYTVFTDVAKYLNWISKYLQNKNVGATSLAPQALTCGKRNVNGTEERAGYWKWHAALFTKRRRSFEYECAGSILNKNTIITAAHCVTTSKGPIPLHRLVVQVGRRQLYEESQHAQDHDVKELIVHPQYNAASLAHNIALVKLVTNISYTDYIQPICLWNRDDDVHSIFGYRATVIGFSNDEDEEAPDTLQEASFSVVDSILCKSSDLTAFSIEERSKMFCAGNRQGNNNCNDETGGGLFFNYDDVWYIRGVMSFPKLRSHVCDPKAYTLVTDVAKYLSWIAKYLQPEGDLVAITSNTRPAPKRCKLRC